MNIEIHDAALEARLRKQLQVTGSGSVEEVLVRLLETQEEGSLAFGESGSDRPKDQARHRSTRSRRRNPGRPVGCSPGETERPSLSLSEIWHYALPWPVLCQPRTFSPGSMAFRPCGSDLKQFFGASAPGKGCGFSRSPNETLLCCFKVNIEPSRPSERCRVRRATTAATFALGGNQSTATSPGWSNPGHRRFCGRCGRSGR